MRGTLILAALLALTASARAEEPVLHVYNWSDYIAPDTVATFAKERERLMRATSIL